MPGIGSPVGSVLVVDSDTRVRRALRAMLMAATTFEAVAVAPDAPAALRFCGRSPLPMLALVDPVLPTLSAGCRLIRVLSAELDIPVVAISAQPELRSVVMTAGALAFLDKTLGSQVLVDAVVTPARFPGWCAPTGPAGYAQARKGKS
jgi:CheY-like chemotaxis protein